MLLRHAAIACAFLWAPSLVAQEPTRPEPKPAEQKPPEKPPLELPPLPGGEAPGGMQQEMLELFAKVENRLRAIDTQLYEAASGRVPTKAVTGSGIEDLLRSGKQAAVPKNISELLQSASSDSQSAQSDIQRILEIAEAMNKKKPSGGAGGGKPKPGSGGKSPLDKPGNGDPQGREQTPKDPGSKPEGSEPKEGDGNPDSPLPEDPNGPDENRPGQNPPNAKTGPGSTGSGDDRWGDLPVRAREIFRVEGGSDLPPQYRDWIDGYYKRLQGLERR